MSKKSKKAAVKVKNLVKKYEDLVAVDNISFEVYEGEIFGILGPNGAGKTTTLEIVETLRKPTSGQIEVDGLDILKNTWEVKSRIGVQLQAAGFYPDLTLVELLQMFASLYQVEIDPIAILKKFSLEDKKKSYFQKLSGGQKQRFSLATTLINNPKIVFLDEPTTGLDPITAMTINELIVKTQKELKGTTVVVTHDIVSALIIGDRLALHKEGKIAYLADPDTFVQIDDPEIRFLHKLISQDPRTLKYNNHNKGD